MVPGAKQTSVPPHFIQHAHDTTENVQGAPRVCTHALWTLSGNPEQPRDLPALAEVAFREPHLGSKYVLL